MLHEEKELIQLIEKQKELQATIQYKKNIKKKMKNGGIDKFEALLSHQNYCLDYSEHSNNNLHNNTLRFHYENENSKQLRIRRDKKRPILINEVLRNTEFFTTLLQIIKNQNKRIEKLENNLEL